MRTNSIIFLDFASTTPVDPRVVEAMTPYFDQMYGNPSSTHQFGQLAENALEGSRRTVADFIGAKPGEIVLVNRNEERARNLSARFDSAGPIPVTSWSDLPGQGAFNLVINATSVGHQGEAPPLAASSFTENGLCYDLNYFKASLPLKKRCEEIQRPYIDGLGMLVEQAAKSFSIWTGKTPETSRVIEACRRDAC